MNKICDQSEDPRIDGNTHQETGGGRPEVVLFLHHGQTDHLNL